MQSDKTAKERIPASSSDLCIGAGMYDITGPAAEVGMFGYAKSGQLTSGIHMRLRARAFAFHHVPSNEHFVYVVADLGMISEWVSQTVLQRLQEEPFASIIPPNTYTRENVMISATHTHCAPGGLSHYFIYSLHPPLSGADKQNFECVVDGILQAIQRAYQNLTPGVIRVAQGECLGASINRSIEAYEANPAEERSKYKHDTDKQMTLWRLDTTDGEPIGMINWFAVHPTSMGNWYTLITGDNKGYAAHVFEKDFGTNHILDHPKAFVAAFAQSNEGDVSPNIAGPRQSETEYQDKDRMVTVASAQLDTARDLYKQALESKPVSGHIRHIHQYADFGTIELKDQWQEYKECGTCTSSGCIGVSMIGGTTFDGRGVSAVPEGVQWGNYPKFTTMPELQSLQKEKPVVFPTERYGLSPSRLPLQLIVIGDELPLIGVPFEMTTMAGRRLRSRLHCILSELGVRTYEPIISGLSNAYCGYLTTREEYAVQRYEGASTHFGPNQLSATCQQFDILARELYALEECEDFKTLSPPSIKGVGAWDYNLPVIRDGLISNVSYGSTIQGESVEEKYKAGDTVSVSFHAAHPKNSLRTQDTFLEIHRLKSEEEGEWTLYADDGDPNTFFHWKRKGLFASVVTIEWVIPKDTPPGRYRIKVNGDYKVFLGWSVRSYDGLTPAFDVVQDKPLDR